MITYPPIEHDRYFHIFNRGINSCNIFLDKKDYAHFLKLADIFLLPVADVFAYALMRNHFHFALYIKKESEIGYLFPENRKTEDLELKWKTHFLTEEEKAIEKAEKKKPVPERMVQHFFNAYAKYFNASRKRTGSLFEYRFKRISISSEEYLKALIVYIHKNPLKHRANGNFWEYSYSSYQSFLSMEATKLDRESVLDLFDGKQNFMEAHFKETEFDIDELTFE